MTLPPWYVAAENWLEEQGWSTLVLVAFLIMGVTVWLIWQGEAAALALWLVYLLLP